MYCSSHQAYENINPYVTFVVYKSYLHLPDIENIFSPVDVLHTPISSAIGISKSIKNIFN